MAKYKLVTNEEDQKIDKETGELRTITRRKYITVKLGQEEKFYMTFCAHIAPIYDLKYADDIKVLVKFCELADYETGEIHLSPKRRGDMVQQLGMQQSNVSKSIKRLKEKDLITGENGEYLLNPVIFWKGERAKRVELLKNKGLSVTFNFTLEED